jgi:DNA-binding LacI/PurR family transcriptional regulator
MHTSAKENEVTVTIKDIAKETGVSHSTVSRALRGSALISKETTQLVHDTALKLSYLPSVAPRSLKTNRSQALGVIVSNIDDSYFSEVLTALVCFNHMLAIGVLKSLQERRIRVPQKFSITGFDNIVFIAPRSRFQPSGIHSNHPRSAHWDYLNFAAPQMDYGGMFCPA